MSLIIGLGGKAEHGKSAASRIIKEWVEKIGYTCDIFEISQIILEHCWAAGLIPNGEARNPLNLAQNKIIVDEGSRIRNEVDKMYWTNKVMEKAINAPVDIAIIPNLRFPHEAAAVKNAKGYVWRVNRVNQDGTPFVSTTRDPNHPCETSLDTWPADFYITNMSGHPTLLEELVVTYFRYTCCIAAGCEFSPMVRLPYEPGR